MRKNHTDEQYLARRRLRELPDTITQLTERLANLKDDFSTVTAHQDSPIAVGNRNVPLGKAMEVLAERLALLPEKVGAHQRVPLGVYRGLRYGMVLHPQFPPEVFLDGATSHRVTLSRDHHGPRAVLNALERIAGGYEQEIAKSEGERVIAETQVRDYRARLGTHFAHDVYFAQLTTLRDQLKAGLSSSTPEPGVATGPDAQELAAQIKALKASATVDPSSDRTSTRSLSAEEPITRQIRRRREMASSAEVIGSTPPPDDDGPAGEPLRPGHSPCGSGARNR